MEVGWAVKFDIQTSAIANSDLDVVLDKDVRVEGSFMHLSLAFEEIEILQLHRPLARGLVFRSQYVYSADKLGGASWLSSQSARVSRRAASIEADPATVGGASSANSSAEFVF
jgi:hypothetical protein